MPSTVLGVRGHDKLPPLKAVRAGEGGIQTWERMMAMQISEGWREE